MKFAIVSAAAIAAAALAAPAFAKDGPEVRIRAVARVAVVVEDRADIAVEVEQGTSALPPVRVTRDGANVRIDGGLRRGPLNLGDGLRNCRSGGDNPARPGEGASVDVRGVGRVNLSDAPLIVIRTPRHVNVEAEGAVFGSVGRGAASIRLGTSGCGDWNVANTDGPLSLGTSGSGDLRVGTSAALELSVNGAGTVTAGATRDLDLSLAGAGDALIARVDGPAEISVAGAGDVTIRAGDVPTLSISVAGVGDVEFGGVAGDVDVSVAGAGNVTVARATGSVSRSVAGVGDVRIGD
ncbi:MAG: GIN domain-containing protein [Brevundimonas sp.]